MRVTDRGLARRSLPPGAGRTSCAGRLLEERYRDLSGRSSSSGFGHEPTVDVGAYIVDN